MTNFPKVARQVVLKSRPVGIPQAENFGFTEVKIPELADGEILVRNEYLSVDPAMRGWVNAVANYSTPVGIGEVMRSFASGKVVVSKHRDYAEGESVTGMFGWQDFAVVNAGAITRKVMETDLPLWLSLGVLGLNGITAYFGLLENGLPRPGNTVCVSTAAGAVGSAVGQIAKLMGCRTIGIRRRSNQDKTMSRRIRLRRRNRLQGGPFHRRAARRGVPRLTVRHRRSGTAFKNRATSSRERTTGSGSDCRASLISSEASFLPSVVPHRNRNAHIIWLIVVAWRPRETRCN